MHSDLIVSAAKASDKQHTHSDLIVSAAKAHDRKHTPIWSRVPSAVAKDMGAECPTREIHVETKGPSEVKGAEVKGDNSNKECERVGKRRQ